MRPVPAGSMLRASQPNLSGTCLALSGASQVSRRGRGLWPGAWGRIQSPFRDELYHLLDSE